MIPQAQISALSKMGFVVVIPNYRLCPQVSVWEGPVQDSKDVLAWCQEELDGVLSKEDGGVKVDGEKVAAVGYSAGGELALLLVSLNPFPWYRVDSE